MSVDGTHPEQIEIAGIVAHLDLGPPASAEALRRLAAEVMTGLGTTLPDDYLAFLRHANGADGTLAGGHPLVLWQAEILREVNEDNLAAEWMPGLFIIGSDAGDAVYGIDLREGTSPRKRYVETDDTATDWDEVFWQGGSLLELLRHLRG